MLLTSFKGLKFIQGARPVRPQQSRQASISQDFAAGLASRAIVGFVIRVANALYLFATPRARFSITAVSRHALTKCSNLLRKSSRRFCPQPLDPKCKSIARRGEQPIPLILFQF